MSLTFNKIAGAVLATGLGMMAVKEAAHIVYHPYFPEKPAYDIPIEVEEAAAPAEAVEKAVDFGLLLASADAARGEAVSKRCASCHHFEKGGPNAQGPDLWDIIGRAPGAAAGFAYSEAMTAYGAANPQWTYEGLYNFLKAPKAYMPGTAMSFAGLAKQEDRIALIAYLRTMSDAPAPLPAPLPPEAPADPSAAPADGATPVEAEPAGEEAAAAQGG
jgi:cytochrome c